MPRSTINHARAFEAFLQNWLIRQETLMHELMDLSRPHTQTSGPNDDEISSLVSRVLSHYQEYFDEKSRMANRNAFLMLSPSWFTPFEKAFLWIGGFKPCLAITLAFNSVNDLTLDQKEKLEILKNETKAEEKLLVEAFAKIQESVGSPPVVVQARENGARGPIVDGPGVREDDVILENLRSAMKNVVIEGDKLRTSTCEEVVAILTPIQTLNFFVGAAQLQLRIRSVGIQKEAERIQHLAETTAANGW